MEKIHYIKPEFPEHSTEIKNLLDSIQKAKDNIQKEMIDNNKLISLYDSQVNELLHYVEACPKFSVVKGYKILKKIAEIRKQRRQCKNYHTVLANIKQNIWRDTVSDKLYEFKWKFINPDEIF